MNRTCMLGDLKKNIYHDRKSITIAVPYLFSNLRNFRVSRSNTYMRKDIGELGI